jgi:hypothetical protein
MLVQPFITADFYEVRLVKMRDHGLHIALGGRQSCETMKCDVMSHCFT